MTVGVSTRRMEETMAACKYFDLFCPCQDGDTCHYEGEEPMRPPVDLGPFFVLIALENAYQNYREWGTPVSRWWIAQNIAVVPA